METRLKKTYPPLVTELFPIQMSQKESRPHPPLAERMRPERLSEIVGHRALLGEGRPLRRQIETDSLPSLIFWGPPGSGKTTIARVIANESKSGFHSLSAVLSGVKELKEILALARKKTILFVDEIHRWNKAQQDALLHPIEDGTIILIGATTENPSFQVIAPLLSRTKVYVLDPLGPDELKTLVRRALADGEKGLGRRKLSLEDEAIDFLVASSDGDARRALNTLEIAAGLMTSRPSDLTIKVADIEAALQKKTLLYDKKGEEHYNVISAFIKSMRGSNPDAAVYYLARMLEAGEDPLFLARRMVIFASEDVGNADPQAIQVAVAAMQSYDFVGMPEGWIPLAQAATYLASAPKSNASYMAYKKAKEDVEELGPLPTPKHIRNAPTSLMKELGYGKDYKYPHDFEGNYVKGEYLPEKLRGKKYYEPTENGYEGEIKGRLEKWKR